MSEWNHNTHYHNLILSILSENCGSALDIGSGLGLFSSKLSSVFKEVYSIEPDSSSVEYSKEKYKALKNISYITDPFIEHHFDGQKFDFISAIASVHHMDLENTLKKMKTLIKSGGSIVILGLYRESSLIDFFISLIAILPNLFMNLRLKKNKTDNCEMITTRPMMTIGEIKNTADKVFGEYRFKRHLFWRYSLVYEPPVN